MKTKPNKLTTFFSSIVPYNIKHAFFGRSGGKSNGDFASLNFASRTGDEISVIQENKMIIADFFAADTSKLKISNQVHSAKVFEITNADQDVQAVKADALVTKIPNVILGVITADCVPILLCEPEAKIVATIHAGWRGAIKGVIPNTVEKIRELGGQPKNVLAVIGPAIQQDSYEVDQAFYDEFINQAHSNKEYFMSGNVVGKYMFNLPSYCTNQLNGCGVGKLDNLALNTYTNPALFFSCRRSTHESNKFGCQLSAIMIEG